MKSPDNQFERHVCSFSKLLIKLRTELNNDLDLVLIMAVIAECHYVGLARQESCNAASFDPAKTIGTANINTLSLALYTDIPRETVRRKISTLVDKGWVTRDPQGNLSPSPQAGDRLAEATAATHDYLATITQSDDPGHGPS